MYGVSVKIDLCNETMQYIINKKFAPFRSQVNYPIYDIEISEDNSVNCFKSAAKHKVINSINLLGERYHKFINNNIVCEKFDNSFILWEHSITDTIIISYDDDTNHNLIGWKIIEYINNCLALRGIVYLHASFVAYESKGIIFVGESGAGKTSLALKFLENGGELLSDDSAYFKIIDGDIHVLRNDLAPNLDNQNLANNFSYLNSRIINNIGEKKSVDISGINSSFLQSIKASHMIILRERKEVPSLISAKSTECISLILKSLACLTPTVYRLYFELIIDIFNQANVLTLSTSSNLNDTYSYIKEKILL